MILDTYTDPDDGVCFFTPVYHEFRSRPKRANGVRSRSPWPATGTAMCWISTPPRPLIDPVKVLIFCAPQNPSGRVWTVEELRAVAEFAARHDLIVISDEIHSDLIYPGAKHVPMHLAAPEHATASSRSTPRPRPSAFRACVPATRSSPTRTCGRPTSAACA
jgi:cystathionine beta-lyase